MATEKIVQSPERILGIDDVGEGLVQDIVCHGPVDNQAIPGPAAPGDGNAKGVLLVKRLQLTHIGLDQGLQLFRVWFAHVWHRARCHSGVADKP